ncbi:MAG: hypothetical protein QOI03_1163 [Solirubrobacteraceae bacterium]|jgi:hypothetical protein|nr:hypothetical protein [Solirubrobacteraceae bacterium]
MHRSLQARTLLLSALISSLAVALTAPGPAIAEEAVKYTHESLAAYRQQLASGQVTALTINKRIRRVHVTLKDGRHLLALYGPHEEPKVAAEAQAKHVPVTVLKPAQAAKEAAKIPVHHKLRYIAGGILIAVIVVVGAVLLIDRRRKAALE